MIEYKKNNLQLEIKDCHLLIIDFQTAFIKIIKDYNKVKEQIVNYTKLAKLLKIPITITEQYPKGLGPTDKAILSQMDDHNQIFEKTCFSLAKLPDMESFLLSIDNHNRKNLLICGLETHVCVMQSCLDLKSLGYQTFILDDATTSSDSYEADLAKVRLRKHGVDFIAFKMLSLELIKDSNHQAFKQIQQMIIN